MKKTIGSKVVKHKKFWAAFDTALAHYDESNDRTKGQYFVKLPAEVFGTVSAGDRLKSSNPDDYIIRHHREGPKMFLRRERAGETQFLAVVVYTRKAFLENPDITPEEAGAIGEATHAIVAVIVSSGSSAPVTPFWFVHNLAGGNLNYKRPTFKDYPEHKSFKYNDDLDRWAKFIVDRAKEVVNCWNNYSVVSD